MIYGGTTLLAVNGLGYLEVIQEVLQDTTFPQMCPLRAITLEVAKNIPWSFTRPGMPSTFTVVLV